MLLCVWLSKIKKSTFGVGFFRSQGIGANVVCAFVVGFYSYEELVTGDR